ncbi:dTDP-Rha--alpha-D-GlcNAc-pyrophosphate polyprenol alpha-3-L-rhamnosyltransferase [Amycolatopsis antarctica]|uniref:dTDP-Rha--alpha-D-GlcNAc-pyrophosphate polyprenol alpha-3-L-rhamnosyltransferase n=1 Tax=Amycolatopsis antarctica TaxID=1854586 RepID=A0A263DA98_9PSEU|nr:glycosyltransferase family 2 protein [Amycolatopsis antarctica]OZM75099.1 dTDP-Rha--alpha-D-GlcNAc-pyrophosphate polyprenol alpha-3-L-rhamnosyltransferase [Amycolatopsis antarctica]
MTEPKTYGDGIAVVIVTYFPGETLERCLDTLEKATTREVRVVLADNVSGDGAPERAAERPGVTLVPMGENVGYGAAANRGVAELGEDVGWVVVANADLEWDAGCLDELLAVAARYPRGGAFGPLIRELDGTVYPSARLLPSLGRGIGHAVFGKVWPGNPWTRAYRQEKGEPAERVSGWLSGSVQLFRRQAWDSTGGFDPRYFMYFEDVDLGDRITRAGWQNVYAPSASVMHLGGHATSRAPAKMLAAHHESAYRYLADRHRGLAWKPVLAAIRLGLAVRLKLETRGG